MNYRLSARVDLYNGQVELQLTLIHTAAHELVTLCITNALQAYVDDPGTRSRTAERLHTTELQDDEPMLQDNVPTWPIEQVVAELTHAARSQSPDDEVLIDALPHGEQVIALQSQLVSPPQPMQYAFQSRPAGTASPEEFVCLPPAMTEDHVVHMVRAEHHPLHVLMAPAPHRADRDQSHVLIAPVPRCAGFTFDPTTALRIPSVTEGAEQDVTAPECDDCDVAYTCEAHRGIYRCDDGVPGCNCSQPEVSIGGAIPIGGADATDDETTTDSEAGTCAGYCYL